MAGIEYDDNVIESGLLKGLTGKQAWDAFIKQMSLKDLSVSMTDNRGIGAVVSIGKPTNSIAEGPEGLLATFQYGDKRSATGFATGPIYTATWDHNMQKKFGFFYGEEALFAGVACVNAPGANINRTPYGSRASEYMSEDGVMNYLVASNIISEAGKKGLIMNVKHCFLNNQETNRQGVATFANEQSIREIYLRPFEGALTKGKGLGIMTSYNRIGLTYAACHSTLMNQILRTEWGYKGQIIDDALGGSNYSTYSNGPAMTAAGTNIFCLDSGRGAQLVDWVEKNDDGNMVKLMQTSNRYIMYSLLRSWMGDEGSVKDADLAVTQDPWWKGLIIGIDITAGVLTLAALGLYITFDFIIKPKEEN
jgi:beta-glucosidase